MTTRHASGEYDVDVYYSCPQEDIGSTLELSFNEDRLRAQITEVHDPPLRGGEYKMANMIGFHELSPT